MSLGPVIRGRLTTPSRSRRAGAMVEARQHHQTITWAANSRDSSYCFMFLCRNASWALRKRLSSACFVAAWWPAMNFLASFRMFASLSGCRTWAPVQNSSGSPCFSPAFRPWLRTNSLWPHTVRLKRPVFPGRSPSTPSSTHHPW